MYTYQDLLSQLHRKNPRKLENNTYARLDGDTISITLHASEIATLQPNKITLTSAGWHTQTTKERLNEIIPRPYQIYQENKVWYVGRGWGDNSKLLFHDGIEFTYNGNEWTCNGSSDTSGQKKLTKAALKYVNDFVDKFMAGEIDNPSGGDCWYCYMATEQGQSLGDATNSDHIYSHIEEKYYVPSLLAYALISDNKQHICPITEDGLARIWDNWHSVTTLDNWQRDIMERDVKACLKRYIYQRLGLAF